MWGLSPHTSSTDAIRDCYLQDKISAQFVFCPWKDSLVTFCLLHAKSLWWKRQCGTVRQTIWPRFEPILILGNNKNNSQNSWLSNSKQYVSVFTNFWINIIIKWVLTQFLSARRIHHQTLLKCFMTTSTQVRSRKYFQWIWEELIIKEGRQINFKFYPVCNEIGISP